MFTGIIRQLGHITAVKPTARSCELTIATPLAQNLLPGSSIAVAGACLTALSTDKQRFTIRLMEETLRKTNLGRLSVGKSVNLELPLAAADRLDGHFVLGHVDGVCRITAITPAGGDKVFTFDPTPSLMPYLIAKGSVALDGVSLTVVDVASSAFTVSMMPYTLDHTTFGTAEIGDDVNIEVDVLGKYVASLLQKREH